MKMSTFKSLIAGFLYIVGFAALICSIVCHTMPQLSTTSVWSLSFVFFTSGWVLLLGAQRAATEAFDLLNTVEHPQWVAQDIANREWAVRQAEETLEQAAMQVERARAAAFELELLEMISVTLNGRTYIVTVGQQMDAYAAGADCHDFCNDVTAADKAYEAHLRVYASQVFDAISTTYAQDAHCVLCDSSLLQPLDQLDEFSPQLCAACNDL